MAKRSIKRPPQVEKDTTGCMWPIIGLFDFRQSPPAPRLLSDVRPASSRRGGRDYSKIKLDKSGRNEDKGENAKKVTGTKVKGDAASFASVKTLMKEDMLQERSNKYELNSDSDFNNQTRPPSLGFDESYSENALMSQDDFMSSKKDHQVENEDMVNKQNRSRFFWSKDKSKEIGSPKKSEELDNQNQVPVENLRTRTKEQKIKSVPNFSRASHSMTDDEEGDRLMSNFSFREIKRKIKSIIGGNKKERRAISMDGILHKVPIGHKVRAEGEKMFNNDSVVASSESKSLHDKKQPSIVSPIASSVINNNRIRNDISVAKSTLIYEEAKKHLVDMLDVEGPRTSSRTAHVSKSLGKLFSMQEDDALRMKMSHKVEKEIALTSEEAVSIPLQKFNEDANNSLSPSKQNAEVSSCSIDYQNDETLGLKTENANKCVVSDPNHAGNVQNVETVDAFSKLLNDQSDASSA